MVCSAELSYSVFSHQTFSLKIYLLIFVLFESQRYTGETERKGGEEKRGKREREREILHNLIYSSSTSNNQGLVRSNPGDQTCIQVSHMYVRDQTS